MFAELYPQCLVGLAVRDGAVIDRGGGNEYVLGSGVWVSCFSELGNYLAANDCEGGTHGSVVDGSTGFCHVF